MDPERPQPTLPADPAADYSILFSGLQLLATQVNTLRRLHGAVLKHNAEIASFSDSLSQVSQ